MKKSLREDLKPKGKVEIFVTKGKPVVHKDGTIDFSGCTILEEQTKFNIIVNSGKNAFLRGLLTGYNKVICRMAIGDRGTIPSDCTVPKTPKAEMKALYNEIYRGDVDVVVENLGEGTHELKFVKSFSALTVPIASFSNQARPIVNEVGLIMCDLLGGLPLPRTENISMQDIGSDEELFSIRCFKSVPFEAEEEIAVTIRYSIFVE